MAVLIVAIKVWYRLDGAPTAADNSMPASPDWLTWAQSALQRLQGPLYPSTDQEVGAHAMLPPPPPFPKLNPFFRAATPLVYLRPPITHAYRRRHSISFLGAHSLPASLASAFSLKGPGLT